MIKKLTYRGRHRKTTPGTVVKASAVSAAVLAGSLVLGGTASAAQPTDVWDQLAQCESGGNWAINTGNGFFGGLQHTLSTWRAFGGSGSPQNASRSEQIAVATRVQASQGWGAWPACSKKLGLSGKPPAQAAVPKAAPKAVDKKKVTPAAPKPAPKASAPKHAAAGSGGYEVVAGDTLSKIAARNHVAGGWQALFNKNKGTVENPNVIFPGEKLSL